MGLIPEEKIAEICERTDLVQVIGEYVSLKKSGTSFVGLCPFHQERSPSFNVIAHKRFFHCFGCGKSGDVFTFLREVEGRSFVDTARQLAERAGIDLPDRSPREAEAARALESERARMVRLLELAASFYQAELATPAAAGARHYLAERGLSDETLGRFRVGFAPAGWEALVRFLGEKRVPAELAERVGLIRRREQARSDGAQPPTTSSHFDNFVERVVYPLSSPLGEVVGFGGRVVDPTQQPKYKNSPETPLFKKGEQLFGLHLAKNAIRRGGRALVVEGNFDVMTLHQHGLDFTVAPQGTALTAAQVALLGRFAKEVVLMLDADPAGRAATFKVIHLFIEAELPLRIAQLRPQAGEKLDPDLLARRDLERLKALVDGATDALELYFEQVAATSAPTVPGRVAAVEECAPLLRLVKDPLARALYVDKLSQLLKIDPELVRRTLRGTRPSGPHLPTASDAPAAAPAVVRVAQRPLPRTHAALLSFLARHEAFWSQIDPGLLKDEAARTMIEVAQAHGRYDAAFLLDQCAPELQDAVAKALGSDEFLADIDPQRTFASIVTAIRLPTDLAGLMRERALAIEREDRELTEKLNARIIAVRRSSR